MTLGGIVSFRSVTFHLDSIKSRGGGGDSRIVEG